MVGGNLEEIVLVWYLKFSVNCVVILNLRIR